LGLRSLWNKYWVGQPVQRDMASDVIGWQYRDRSKTGSVHVTQETALRHSAVWACLRLRANLISTLPVDVFRMFEGRQLEVAKPNLLIEPAPGVLKNEHFYSSTMDLDRYGNSVGIITARDAGGRPMQIELAPMADVSAKCKGYQIQKWRIAGEEYDPAVIWHEKQYTIGGWPLGLSPIAYAAWTVGGYLSAQQFALDWFTAGAAPTGVLKNTAKQITEGKAAEVKTNFKLAVSNRDIFVHGNEWEWTPAQQEATSVGFLDEMEYGVTDVCRFLDVPADMIDAAKSGSHVTYANTAQRFVQLLVLNLGPAIARREEKWSTATARGQFVKLNTDALLRMDPKAREEILLARVAGRVITPDEERGYNNLPPLTDAQIERMNLILGDPKASASAAEAPEPQKGVFA
jgi:HK97 family phage portal protein